MLGDQDRIGLIICTVGGHPLHASREQEWVALHFAALGMSCFVLRCHVCPWRFPTQLMDTAQAVRHGGLHTGAGPAQRHGAVLSRAMCMLSV